MPTITKYLASQTPEGLLIKDVIMAVTGKPSGKPEVTDEMMAGFVSNFDKRVNRGSIGAYVLLNHDGPRVGKIVGLRKEGNQLIGDLLITEASIAARVAESDLTDISITFWPKDQVLADVSLLDNAFGALSDAIPPLLVDVQQEFGLSADNTVEYRLQDAKQTSDNNKGNEKELIMELTPEQLSKMIDDAVKAALAKDTDTDSDPVNEKKVEEALAKLQKKELDITIDGFVRNLKSRGGYSGHGLRARFEKFGTNVEAMEVEYKRLMDKSNEDIQLEMEAEYEAPKLEDVLRAEWEQYKATYKSDMDFVTFSRVVKGEGKAELGSKPINYVEGSIKL